MTRLIWGTQGERFYETGADRGVLYVPGNPGVPWNGLTAVTESPSGGEPRPFYLDGYKYINLASAEEFEATIEAFSSPTEFAQCDGTRAVSNGLFVTQQPRVQFGLSYRTMIGNDTEGIEHGYKIHLVYNGLAAPSSRNNGTISDSPEPNTYSWAITTAPPLLTGFRPTAHMVVDSRKTAPSLLEDLEDLLYGSASLASQLPSQADLIEMFI